MSWEHLGRVVVPPLGPAWAATHAALPSTLPLDGTSVELFCSPRDERGRARLARGKLILEHPFEARFADQPILPLGSQGSFDDCGQTHSTVVDAGDAVYLYYSGWTLGRSVPFHFYVGGAVSHDRGASYRPISASPLLERDEVDPYLTASPAVLVENGVFRMWYVSGVGWFEREGELQPSYHIKYAESNDGVRWRRSGLVCIDFESEDEYAIARPCVSHAGGRYRMWFCSRGSAYRIGYAESPDGLHWERMPHDIRASGQDWDSEMMAYPHVFNHAGVDFMLYNGNDYGRTGIGLAREKGWRRRSGGRQNPPT